MVPFSGYELKSYCMGAYWTLCAVGGLVVKPKSCF